MPDFSSTFGGGGAIWGSIKVTIPPVPNVRKHLWAAVQRGSAMVLRTAKKNIRNQFALQGRQYRGKWQTAEERLKARRKRRTTMRAANRKALRQGLAEGRAQEDIETPFSEQRVQALGVRHGNLCRSMMMQFTERKLEGRIGPSAIYGRIRELGGVIRPKNKPRLAWVNPDTGGWVVLRKGQSVTQHGKPYLRPALEANKSAIEELLRQAIKNAILQDTSGKPVK